MQDAYTDIHTYISTPGHSNIASNNVLLQQIASATANVEQICEEIIKSERLASPSSLRLAIIAYRDHPPQDVSYITKKLPFTSDITQVKEFLKTLYASGGGDGPEAVTAAMKEAIEELEWRENASRITLLIADAPPHGGWISYLVEVGGAYCSRLMLILLSILTLQASANMEMDSLKAHQTVSTDILMDILQLKE